MSENFRKSDWMFRDLGTRKDRQITENKNPGIEQKIHAQN